MADLSQYKPALTYEFLKRIGSLPNALPAWNNTASLQAIQTRTTQINVVIEELANCLQLIEVWDRGAFVELSSNPTAKDKTEVTTRNSHLTGFRKQLAHQKVATRDVLNLLNSELANLHQLAMKLRPNV